ncbi:MAG: DUF4340 domain-containing protein [Spirochaetaceae bacterium]|nr:MAG: DUF4340 domain-containing protein [Spirochaetaceae bacterium]
MSSLEGVQTVVRRNGEWKILIGGREYPGHARHIQSLLDLLASVKQIRQVAAGSAAKAAFGLTEEPGRYIILLDGDNISLAHLHVGKRDGQDGGSFVRLDGHSQVVLLNRALDFYLDAPSQFWSNLRLFPDDLKAEDIIRLATRGRINLPELGELYLDYVLVKDVEGGNTWNLGHDSRQRASFKLDSTEVDSLANAIAVMEGLAFSDQGAVAEKLTEKPVAELDLRTRQGREYRLLVFGPEEGGVYYTKSSESSYLFPTADWRLPLVLKPLSSLEQQ